MSTITNSGVDSLYPVNQDETLNTALTLLQKTVQYLKLGFDKNTEEGRLKREVLEFLNKNK